jgi:hypothetical protein
MLPWGRDMRTAVFLASVLVGLVGTTAARAQVFDLDADRMPVVELKGLWRFHTGDDPDGKLGWASPEFDDAMVAYDVFSSVVVFRWYVSLLLLVSSLLKRRRPGPGMANFSDSNVPPPSWGGPQNTFHRPLSHLGSRTT